MKTSRSLVGWVLGLSLLALVAVGIIAPLLRVDRFGDDIREALEQALGRKVEIGEVRLDMLAGPGFSVQKVVIHEDPAIGLEPFAYVTSLEVTPRVSSLWTRRLELSSIRLVEPSVNLTKGPQGNWNFQSLLHRNSVSKASSEGRLPSIELARGRINFKTADVKSVFYFTSADLEIQPDAGSGRGIRFDFSVEPARTDHPAQGFGRFRGSGRWISTAGKEDKLDLDLHMEEAPIAELVTLFYGHDIGIHGRVSSDAELVGPVSNLAITGTLRVTELYRWDMPPSKGPGWVVDYGGKLDMIGHTIEMGTKTENGKKFPLSGRLRVSDYLGSPQFGVTLQFDQLPAGPVLDVARQLGLPITRELTVDGQVVGAVGYSTSQGVMGQLTFQNAVMKFPETRPVEFKEAQVDIDKDVIRLLPSHITTGGEETAVLGAEYHTNPPALIATISSPGLRVQDLLAGLRGWTEPAEVPVLEACLDGTWSGTVNYQQQGGEPGQWIGDFQLRGARIALPAIAEPLVLETGRVRLLESDLEVTRATAHVGNARFTGSYRYKPGSVHPHRWTATIAELRGVDLQRILMPVLNRQKGFLARTLGFGRTPMPEWLLKMAAEGTLQIGHLQLGDLELSSLNAKVYSNGPLTEFSNLTTQMDGGSFTGKMSVDLREAVPVYRINGKVAELPWMDGSWAAEGVLNATGFGAELLDHMTGDGSFSGRNVSLGAESEFRSLNGCFELRAGSELPLLELTCMEIDDGESSFYGQGTMAADGRMRLDLSDGRREMRVTGTWRQPEVDRSTVALEKR